MNRLWLRISAIIVLTALITTLLPFVIRELTRPTGGQWPQPPTEITADLDPAVAERIAEAQERQTNRAWQTALTSLGVGALLGVSVGIWMSRSISKPLTELERGAHEVAAHNLAYRVPEQGTAEMQTVAHAFNDMAAELEQSETLRRNMLADITHELRHPVHVLGGNLQGILDGVFPLEMGEIAQLSEQTQHLSTLISDLHELSLAEAQELPLHPVRTDMGMLIGAVIDAIAPLAKKKAIQISAEIPPTPIFQKIDPDRMRQVLHNLMGNAIRYTPEGGRVMVTLTPTEIVVSDTGIGISAEDLPHLFDRFFRSDASRSRDSSGTGLGLAVTKAIVEAHGGTISAESAGRHQGSSFTLTFPPE